MRLSKGKMDVVVLDDLQLVWISIGGELVVADFEGCYSAHSAPDAQSYNNLYDFRNCNLHTRIFDLYNFPRTPLKKVSSGCKTIKVALLTNQGENYEKLKFYEVTSINSGFNSKVFTREQEAVAWVTNHSFSQSPTDFDCLSEEERSPLSQ